MMAQEQSSNTKPQDASLYAEGIHPAAETNRPPAGSSQHPEVTSGFKRTWPLSASSPASPGPSQKLHKAGSSPLQAICSNDPELVAITTQMSEVMETNPEVALTILERWMAVPSIENSGETNTMHNFPAIFDSLIPEEQNSPTPQPDSRKKGKERAHTIDYRASWEPASETPIQGQRPRESRSPTQFSLDLHGLLDEPLGYTQEATAAVSNDDGPERGQPELEEAPQIHERPSGDELQFIPYKPNTNLPSGTGQSKLQETIPGHKRRTNRGVQFISFRPDDALLRRTHLSNPSRHEIHQSSIHQTLEITTSTLSDAPSTSSTPTPRWTREIMESISQAVVSGGNWNKIQFIRYLPHKHWDVTDPDAKNFEILGAKEYVQGKDTSHPDNEEDWDIFHKIVQEKVNLNKAGYEFALMKFNPKDLWIMNFVLLGLDDILPNICWLYCHKLVNAIVRATADHRMTERPSCLRWAFSSRIIYQTSARPILAPNGTPDVSAYRRQRILPGMKPAKEGWYEDPPYIDAERYVRSDDPEKVRRILDCENYPVTEVKDAVSLQYFLGRFSLVILLSRCQPWQQILGDLISTFKDDKNLPTGIICHDVHSAAGSFNCNPNTNYPDEPSPRLREIITKYYEAYPFDCQSQTIIGPNGEENLLPTNLRVYLRRSILTPPGMRHPLEGMD